MVRTRTKTLTLETLEDRCVPATQVQVNEGILVIAGDDKANAVTLEKESRHSLQLVAIVTEAGRTTRYHLGTEFVLGIVFDGKGGADTFDLRGVKIPGDVRFHGGDGHNAMRFWDAATVTGDVSYFGGKDHDHLGIDGEVIGNVHFAGGSGNDRLLYNKAVIRGTTAFWGGPGHDTLDTKRTALVLGTMSAIGDAGNDTLVGGSANDELKGGEGHDSLVGGKGHDLLSGGDGVDWLHGGEGNDTLLGGTGYDRLYGGANDDTLDGGQDGSADRLVGEDGNDIFFGEWYFVPISTWPYWGWVNYDKPLDPLGLGDTVTNRGR